MSKVIPFVNLREQNEEVRAEIENAINDIINRSCFVGGDYVTTFERDFAEYIGVREAVAVAKPLILSNNKASTEYFNKGVLFTDNTLEDMHRVFLLVIEEHANLVGEMEKLGEELPLIWKNKADMLMQKIRRCL